MLIITLVTISIKKKQKLLVSNNLKRSSKQIENVYTVRNKRSTLQIEPLEEVFGTEYWVRLWEEESFRVLLEYDVLQPAIDSRYQMEPELEVECEANVPMPTYFYKYVLN